MKRLVFCISKLGANTLTICLQLAAANHPADEELDEALHTGKCQNL